jgi:hypothetical protein
VIPDSEFDETTPREHYVCEQHQQPIVYLPGTDVVVHTTTDTECR